MVRPVGIRDAVDRQLIALLQINARQSTMALAKRLGQARSTVQERLRRLEQDGVIRGYNVRLGGDPAEEQALAVALLSLAQRQQHQVIGRLALLPELRFCGTVGGGFDLVLLLEAPRLEDLDALIAEILRIPGIDACRTYVVLARKLDRLSVPAEPPDGFDTS